MKKPVLSTSEDLDKFHKELQLLWYIFLSPVWHCFLKAGFGFLSPKAFSRSVSDNFSEEFLPFKRVVSRSPKML